MNMVTPPIVLGAVILCFMPGRRAVANDDIPCQMFVCMAGKVQGNGEANGCSGAISEYFAYQVWDPDFDPDATAALRDKVIGGCAGIGSDASGKDIQLRERVSVIYGRSPTDF